MEAMEFTCGTTITMTTILNTMAIMVITVHMVHQVIMEDIIKVIMEATIDINFEISYWIIVGIWKIWEDWKICFRETATSRDWDPNKASTLFSTAHAH